MIIPAVVVVETYRKTKVYSRKKIVTLGCVVLGVGIATVTDASLNTAGLLFGLASVATTAQFQMWQGGRAKEFEMSPLQMVNCVARYQFVIACLFAWPMDFLQEDSGMNQIQLDVRGAGLIMLSCTFAVGSYFASFGLIGKTSAVTYQVIGHTKTCCILLGGFIFFPVVMEFQQMARNLTGVIVALLGAVVYGNLGMQRDATDQDWCDHFAPTCLLELLQGQTEYAQLPMTADLPAEADEKADEKL